ncbi:uncharacterized protein EAE97_002924 [Botrytis byssoidea]|uniref:RTA1 domain protein n=1 Tax=Botrytis byssoidea TaxID=139641 RepID=A0A9P5M876_9HELO|nr:uncharacterized protein EAE97_002924 [Botrytis byssoidea]KAF7949415.1 hypothetical protein EAE97_002924 [Botrytis byssoidea]
MFTAGYALREYGAYKYIYNPYDAADTSRATTLIVFILSQVFIYICPPLLELANYHILGRLFYYVPYYAPMPANRVLATFGGLMALVEVLNSLGVALASNTRGSSSTVALGAHLTVAAVSIQLIAIIIFVSLGGIFYLRLQKASLDARNVNTMIFTLFASMALIFIRSIYRLVEHAGPSQIDISDIDALRALSPLYRYEVFFYVFEASVMLINSALWNIWNPGRFIPCNDRIHLTREGIEVEGPKDPDTRSALIKTLNVLTFGLLFQRKRMNYVNQELSEYRSQDGISRKDSVQQPFNQPG